MSTFLFWFLLLNNLIALVILHLTMKGSGTANKNLIFGVKIPTKHLNDTTIQTIVGT